MPETRTVMFDGKPNVFPADFTDKEISAALDAIPASNAKAAPKAKTWTDVAVDALPAAGATLGGIVGGVGGTAFGVGVGGVPGAAAGAGLGGAAGEAARQLVNRVRGADAPVTPTDAALAIGKEGAIDAGVTGAVGATGQVLRPYAGQVLQKLGSTLESPSTLRQLAGKAVSATGRAIDAADAVPAPKISLNAADVAKIQQLKSAGMAESEAVRRVWNLKVQNILKQ